MTSCCHNVDDALWLTIPLLDELLDLVQWAVPAATQEHNPHHAFAGAALVTHKLHPIPLAIVRQRKSGEIKSAGPGGNVLPMPEIDGRPLTEPVIRYRHREVPIDHGSSTTV